MRQENAVDVERPLRGRLILVTRTREQAGALSARLQALGASTLEFPVIRLEPPADWAPLDAALQRLNEGVSQGRPGYSWLVFTSVNGVRFCCERLAALGLSLELLRSVRVAAIGPATAAALRERGVDTALVPEAYIAEEVAASLIAESRRLGEQPQRVHVLLARAAEARQVLVEALQQAGMEVDEVAAYRTLPAAGDDQQAQQVLQVLREGRLAMVTFTSSSTVRYFVSWLQEAARPAAPATVGELLQRAGVALACIGPVTAHTARELGLSVAVEAPTFTIDGLVEAIVHYYLLRPTAKLS